MDIFGRFWDTAAQSNAASDQICYSEDSTFLNNADPSLTSVCTASETENVCRPEEDRYTAYRLENPSVLWDMNPSAPTCRGQFSNPDDYLKLWAQSKREARLGATLANLPSSPEEGIKADPKIIITPGVAYDLGEVWKGLPEQVRVFLSTVKENPGLGIAYEPANATAGMPARWHVFEMSAAQAQNPNPPADGKTGKPILTPPNEPAANFSVGSAVAGTALVLGVSLGIQKLFPDLKNEPKFFLNLASMYGINYVMFRAGFYPNYNWKTFTGQIPGMFSFGFVSSILVDGVGRLLGKRDFQFGGFGHELATWGITLGAFYTIAGSETLAPLLTGGVRTVSGLSWAAPAGGAGALGGIGQGLKVAGWFGIANLAVGVGKWAYFHASGDADTPEGRLDDYVSDLVRQKHSTDSFLGKYAGSLWDGFMGHIQDLVIRGLCKFSSDAERGRQMEYDEVKNNLIDGSQEFGTSVRKALAQLVARSIQMDTGSIDWSAVEQGIKEMYAANSDGVENVYKILEYTGYRAPDAQEVKNTIDEEGNIQNRETLRAIAITELQKIHDANDRGQMVRLKAIGAVREVGNQVFLLPPEELNNDQKAKMESEVIPLALENQFYGEALKLLNAGVR
jgi:hypothetical protein